MTKLLFTLSFISLIYNYLIIFNTESFILFMAFFTLIILIISNNKSIVHYDKELFKFNETIYFYSVMKLWYRVSLRENDIKSLLFANFVIDILNYQVIFIEKSFVSESLKNNEYNNLVTATRNRLDKHRDYTINNLKLINDGLYSLPITSATSIMYIPEKKIYVSDDCDNNNNTSSIVHIVPTKTRHL